MENNTLPLTRMRPTFEELAGQWEPDGSLRDIYVFDTLTTHWERFDRLLSRYKCTFGFDGMPQPFPGSQSALENCEGSTVLSIYLGGPIVNCHFFIAEQLELDISPYEITGAAEHEQVLSFVEDLAETLELPAHITPESREHDPFLTYVPAARSWVRHIDRW